MSLRRRRLTSQPVSGRQVNWSHPLLVDCHAVFDGRVLHLRNGKKHTATRNRIGRQGFYSSASSGYIPDLDVNKVGLLFRLSVPSWPGDYSNGATWQFYVDSGTNYQYGMQFWSPSNNTAVVCRQNSALFGATYSETFPITDSVYRVQADGTWGSTVRLYKDGVLQASSTTFGTFATDSRKALFFNNCAWGFAFDDRQGALERSYRALQADPWQVFVKPVVGRRDAAAGGGGGDVTIALTGQAVTTSAGSLLPNSSINLSDFVSTAVAGTLSPAISVALAGSAISISAGTLIPALAIPLSGISVSALAGTLTPTGAGDISVALTGAAVSALAGTLTPNASLALLGEALSALAGTLVPGLSVTITGSSTTISAGTLSVVHTNALTGESVTVAAGTLTPSGGVASATVTIRAGSWIRYQKIQ